MKFILSIVLFVICALPAGAQRFSTSLSKEETISYINNKLQNSLKEEYDKVTFTGNEIILIPKVGSVKHEYKITDWADFKDIGFTESGKDNNLFLALHFKKKIIL